MTNKQVNTQKKNIYAQRVIGFITLAILLLFNVPWFPEYFKLDVDASWIFNLHKGFAEGWQFGRDIVWHYGPLGFLYGKYYYPGTYNLLLSLWAAFSVVFFFGIYRIITKSHAQPNFIALPIMAVIISMSFDALFLALPIIFFVHVLFVERSHRSKLNWLLVLACAAAAHIKISYFILSAIVILLTQVYLSLHHRRPPVFLVGYVVLYLLIWVITGQDIGNLALFLQGAFEHGAGFGTAMAWFDNPDFVPVLYVLGAIIMVSVFSYSLFKKYEENGDAWRAVCAALCMIVSLEIAMKVGFLNSNGVHVFEAVAVFIIIALLFRDFVFHLFSPFQINLLALYCFCVAGYAVFSAFEGEHDTEIGKVMLQGESALATQAPVFSELKNIFSDKDKKYEEALAAIREKSQILKVEGSTDIMNDYQIALNAHGLDYKPRPVFQSYHTFTPYLAGLNREYFKSSAAPENILFALDVMMSRYPSLDDGSSWPELLTKYDIKKIHNSYLYLEKAMSPRHYSINKTRTINVGWEENIKVEESGKIIWAKINIKPTLLGKLANLVYRNVYANMTFTTASGYTRTDRIIPAVASEGFVLSPLVDNTLHFAILASNPARLSDLGIKNISLSLEEDNWFTRILYDENVEVILSELSFEKQQNVISGLDELKDIAELSLHPLNTEIAPIENVVDRHVSYVGNDSDKFLRINGEAKLYLPIAADKENISVEYGVFNQFYYIKELTKGVTFAIYGRKADGAEDLLWSDTTAGLEQKEQGISGAIEVSVEPGEYSGLIFSATPVDKTRSNWEYWSNLKVE